MLESVSSQSLFSEKLPVKADEALWVTLYNPTRLSRSFEFNSLPKIRYFINEILSYQDSSNHHCTMIVENMFVTIETYTHDILDVTESDLKLAKFSDEVYEDTRLFLNV
jgi:pterin-4a-carbinolamine dehydratase